MLSIGQLLNNRYRIDKQLGAGGFGAVYYAWDARLNAPCAVKENGETTAEGALRECLEEANARVVDPQLYTMVDIPHINQVYIFFRATLAAPEFSPGEESLAVELFREEDIPWDEIAFPSVKQTLEHFFRDRKTGEFRVRTDSVRHRR